MWRVIISCSAEAWKAHAVEFKAIAEKYAGTCTSSKKMPDGQRLMEYKIEDVGDAESFQDDCLSLAGFTASFESL